MLIIVKNSCKNGTVCFSESQTQMTYSFVSISSIREYVEDCDDYVLKLVDNLLDTLTKGQHTKTMDVLQVGLGPPACPEEVQSQSQITAPNNQNHIYS